MKKMTSVCLMAWVLLGTFAVANLNAQTTIQRSLYVSAKGNDNNNGRSEETPYKTLRKAVETANAGVIKTITVIGTIEESISINQTGADEILITGKPDASGAERAVLNGRTKVWDSTVYQITVSGKIRFTHIRLDGMLRGNNGIVTLGTGVVVSNPHDNRYGVYEISELIMIDDAAITGCYLPVINVGTVTMSDNASITNNDKGIETEGSVTMSGNAKVSGNKSTGVICAILTMSGNAEISGNNETRDGGGVRVQNLKISGNARIINNAAKGNGGGASISGNSTISGNAIISGNTAKQGGGIYLFGTLTMEGGEISSNKAENGAGVYVNERRTFNHKDGAITGNNAEFIGGGVYVKSGGTYTAGGGRVTGNTSGDMGDDNVFRQ